MTLRVHTPQHFQTFAAWLSWILILLGLGSTGVYLWSEADRWAYARLHLEEFEYPSPLRSDTPLAPALVKTAPPTRIKVDARVVGQLEIPKLDLKAVVSRGIDSTTLRRSVGHVPGTALPGETGNAVLAAHRDTFFAALRRIERGDLIRFRRRTGETVAFRVDSLAVVEKDAVEVMAPSPERRMTLVTCYPFDYIGPSPRRFIVGAKAE
jgi:sortase A